MIYSYIFIIEIVLQCTERRDKNRMKNLGCVYTMLLL